MRTIYYKLIAIVLGSLGLGCSKPMEMEYGQPWAKYRLTGKVIAAANQAPLEGIQISFLDGQCLSDTAGSWQLNTEGFPCNEDRHVCQLMVLDVDGAAHGGLFDPQQIELNLTQTEPRSGNWDRGTFEQKDITIRMEKHP